MHLYSKKVLSNGAFRIYRLLLDIQNQHSSPTYVRASRRLLMQFTGLSENALKSAVNELIKLKLIVLKGERPSLWAVNDPSQFDLAALDKLVAETQKTSQSEADTAD